MPMSDDKIKEVIAEFDKNGDGCIDFDEFCAMMREGKI
jgi:Ca2+-binding EF-hand superfamily protein